MANRVENVNCVKKKTLTWNIFPIKKFKLKVAVKKFSLSCDFKPIN